MRNDQTQDSLLLTAALAAGFGLVAFGIALAIGGWDYSPAAGVGVGVAAATGVFLLVALHRPDRNVPSPAPHAAAEAAPSAPAPAPATAVVTAVPAAAIGTKPAGLAAPRGGRADDLKLIRGVGPKLEELCHRLGYYHFDQIAAWTADEVAWVDENLEGFRGRVTRDDWVGQARILAAGGTV